jgi:phosphoglycolate phosphatase
MFDYDGVIMDSNHCPMEYYEMLSKEIGTRRFKDWQECRAILEANYRLSLAKLGVTEPERLEVANKLFWKNEKEMWANLNIFPNVKEMLIQLKELGYILAIVSNNHNSIMIPDLKKNNIFVFFDFVIDREKGVKPSTASIIHCLKLAGVNADQAVMIEDMDGGLIAAKNAGLKKAIGVSYGYQPLNVYTWPTSLYTHQKRF